MLLVAPSVLRSAEVEVRLIVSPVPAPRLIVPAPMRMASSWAPLSVTVSVPDVPVRLPVSTLVIVGVASAEMSPLATTFSTSRAAAEIDRAEPGPLRRGHRHRVVAALPVSVSMPETLPVEKSTVVAARQHDLVACAAAAVGAALDRSPATNWPLARLIVSSPPPASIVSAPDPPVMMSAWSLPVTVKASVWPVSVWSRRLRRRRPRSPRRPGWSVGRTQRVEVGRGRGQVDRVAGAGAEIDRARADEDGVRAGRRSASPCRCRTCR